MAYDYEKTKAAYEKLSKEQQKQFVEQNKNNANVQQFAMEYARDMANSSKPKVVQSPYENQGAGTYKFNESTGYYENQTDTSKNTVNQGLTPRPETKQTTIQETPVKQEEKVITTDTKNQTSNVMTPLSNDYYQQTSDIALNTIKNNLNQYKQTNPEYFTDYDSFKKNFSYDLRNDEQKNVLDTWYKGYEKGLTLSATPVNELYTQYQDGSISLNDLENLRISNPTKYAELQNQINKGNIISAYDDDKGNNGTNIQEVAYNLLAQAVTKLSSGDYGTSEYFDEFKNNMNSPEMLDLQDKTTELENQAKDIEDEIASISKDVENEYEGTGATRSKINAIIADRTYDLQQQLRTINNEYNRYATQYNNRANQYQQEFQLRLQEYQLNMQARNQQMNELGFAMDLMNFETNEQKAQREWDYWVRQQEYTNGDINSKDYSTRYKAALKSVQNLLSEYEGIPMQRSAEQMADDILTAINNGSTLGAELTKINKQIQEKPEYKKLYNATFGTSQGFGQAITIGGQDYVEYDGKLYTSDEFNKKFGGKANYTVVSADKLKTYSDGRANTFGSFMANPKNDDKNYVGECAKFVNNYLQEIGAGRPFGNEDIETRKRWINSDEGKVGTIAVFDYNHYSSDGINHGHVGIVVSAPDKNGNFWVKDANFDSDGKIQTRKVNINDVSLKGFIDPSKDKNGNSLSSNGTTTATTVGGMSKAYEPTRVGLYDKYINEGTAPTDAKLKAIGNGDLDKGWQIFDAEVADYMDKTGAGSLDKKKTDEVNKLRTEMHSNQAYTDYNQMQSYFQKIKDASNNETATPYSDMSLLFAYMKMLDPKSIVRESEFKSAQDAGSLPTKWQAKWKEVANGEKLTDKQRTQIYNEAAGLMDGATYLYNNLLDDYSAMISYGGDASRLGKKGTYYTDEYINQYGNTTSSNTTENWQDGLNKSSDVFKVSTNIGGYKAPANFY